MERLCFMLQCKGFYLETDNCGNIHVLNPAIVEPTIEGLCNGDTEYREEFVILEKYGYILIRFPKHFLPKCYPKPIKYYRLNAKLVANGVITDDALWEFICSRKQSIDIAVVSTVHD